jgi:hypothetical protein
LLQEHEQYAAGGGSAPQIDHHSARLVQRMRDEGKMAPEGVSAADRLYHQGEVTERKKLDAKRRAKVLCLFCAASFAPPLLRRLFFFTTRISVNLPTYLPTQAEREACHTPQINKNSEAMARTAALKQVQ